MNISTVQNTHNFKNSKFYKYFRHQNKNPACHWDLNIYFNFDWMSKLIVTVAYNQNPPSNIHQFIFNML